MQRGGRSFAGSAILALRCRPDLIRGELRYADVALQPPSRELAVRYYQKRLWPGGGVSDLAFSFSLGSG